MKPEKILIIEEDRETNLVLSNALQNLGYFPDFSMEQTETLFKIDCIDYSIIFLNPCLPQIDASKIFNKLKEASSSATLILIGDMKEKDRVLSFCNEASLGCLYKPLYCQEIALGVQKSLEIKSLKEEIDTTQTKLDMFKEPDHAIYSLSGQSENLTLEDVFEKKLDIFVKKMCLLEKCNLFDIVFDRLEKRLMEMVLNETGGNQIRAANILGISRNTLRKKIKGK
mgnify:CR=1 FL=1